MTSWFNQYGLTHFEDYNVLKETLLARFEKKKIHEYVLKKLRELKQKNLGVEIIHKSLKPSIQAPGESNTNS